MEDLSTIQAVVITPISKILPFAAAVGLISGTVSGFFLIAIRRWRSEAPVSRMFLSVFFSAVR